MRYEPTFWENGKTPLNDDNLNKIETGLSNLSENVEELNSTVENLSTTIEDDLAEVREDIEELKNKVDGGLRFEEMLGKSEQNGTPTPSAPISIKSVKGKNRLNCSGLTAQTLNGVTFTPVYDSNGYLLYINANGKASANAFYQIGWMNYVKGEIYSLNGCPAGGASSTYNIFTSKSAIGLSAQDVGSGVTFTVSDNAETNVVIAIYSGVTVNNLRFYPMIRTSGNSSYVPYGLIELKTHGKNFLKGTSQSQTINGVTFTINSDGSVTANGTATADASLYFVGKVGDTVPIVPAGTYMCGKSNNQNALTLVGYGKAQIEYIQTKEKEVNAPNGISWVVLRVNNGTVANNIKFYPMIRLVDTDDKYEPYQESVSYLSDIDLNGIGDLKDRLIRKDGLWQIERKFATVVLDGSADEAWNTSSSFAGRYYVDGIPNAKRVGKGICTHSTHTEGTSTEVQGVSFFSGTTDGRLNINTSFETLAEWKAYLQTSPMALVYELATPTYEVLPTAEQIALNSLLTFDGTTYLSIESELEPQFTLEYGTSKVGGYTLKSLNTAEVNTARLNAIETLTSNLATAIL